uniref:Uncharacterized protein n=1 Tax=Rhizophora mucronata TaxID=61149 RepID=A0A2P2NJU8_RHIMU
MCFQLYFANSSSLIIDAADVTVIFMIMQSHLRFSSHVFTLFYSALDPHCS